MQVVVVTGMSGSGKSTVMDVMEDIALTIYRRSSSTDL